MTAKPRPLYYTMRILALIIQSFTFGTIFIYLPPDGEAFSAEILQRTIAAIILTSGLAVCVFVCCYNETNLRKLRRQCALPDNFFSQAPSPASFVPLYNIPAHLIRLSAEIFHLPTTSFIWIPLLFAIYTAILRYIVSHDDFLKRLKDLKRKLTDLLPKTVPQIAS